MSSRVIMGRLTDQSDETPRLRGKKKVIRREQRNAAGKAPTPQKSLPSPPTSEAHVIDRYSLSEKLKAELCSVLMCHFCLLKIDRRDEEPSNSSGSGSSELSLSRSCGRRQDADRPNTQTGQEKHQTDRANLSEVVFSKPFLNCLSPSSSYSGLIPSYCSSLSSVPYSKNNRDGSCILHCSRFLKQDRVPAGGCSSPYLQESPFSTLVASHYFLL